MTNIKLHNILGEQVGKNEYNLDVNSVSEAIRAIEILSKRNLYKNLLENDKKNIRYQVLINGREFECNKKDIKPEDLEAISNSELAINIKNLKTIDIVPVIEGAGGTIGSIITTIIGAILVVAGLVLISSGIGVALLIAGLGLVVGGVTNLLTKPPKFKDFREIENGGNISYLFNGPQNTIREGGPVPVGYGRMIVGSQVLSSSYEIKHIDADLNPLTT